MSRQVAVSPQDFRRRLAQIILLPVLLLTILVVVFLIQLAALRGAVGWVNHTHEVIVAARGVEELMLDQQVDLRGYLLTGDPVLLAGFRADRDEEERHFAALAALAADNPAQAARLPAIRESYAGWVAYSEELVARRAGGTSAEAIAEGQRRMDATRALLDAFVAEEERLLAERLEGVERSTRTIIVTSIASIFVIGGVLWFGVWRQVLGLTGQYERALTESERQQAALRESEGRFRDLANALPQLTWTTYADGNVSFLNQRWYDYTGLTPEGVSGWDWAVPIHPDDRERVCERWRRALAENDPFEVEYRFRRADNEQRWYLMRAVPVRDDDGRVVYWVGAGTDIDDHKRAEESLRERTRRLGQATRALAERNRELDQFAYVTSHDLKAPLRGISNLAQWIEEDLGELASGDIRQQLDLLRGRAQRMESLIDGILQFSRIGRVNETIEAIDVGGLLAETVDLLAPPPSFVVAIDPDMPTVSAERARLQQVFANLIGNALKHHDRPDGRIAVRVIAGDEPGYYQFAVADDGPGIAPQYHERIFGIFQTLKPRDQVEGSGLGLALVKKIVERHGGRIWIESEDGCGTTFHFTWPEQTVHEGA